MCVCVCVCVSQNVMDFGKMFDPLAIFIMWAFNLSIGKCFFGVCVTTPHCV